MSKSLDDINDILIVKKITEKEPDSHTNNVEEIPSTSDFAEEQRLIAEEQEVIVRKGLQLLQADERGKQALISEINALRQKQEKRAQLLRYRQHALDIEKERAKKVAMLPPPLPASVKLLLKKYDDTSKPDKPDVQMPDELQTFPMKGVHHHVVEDKENILDPEELEAKQKLQEEWQIKAKKRFNEALKKDRQKEEYSKVMKEIQNAELLNRRKLAKSISSEKKSIPCPLSDKFQTVQKQTEMEEAAEKVFKKMSKREHVIEDIEGYQDFCEEKYKKIDSEFESKMIDCVPDFVKENYEYLLEDNSKFQGGKNFSGLDDSSPDVLNDAYIETPPDREHRERGVEIDHTINHLDKLRSELQAEYDQTLKPLLVAAISEHDIPKKESSDKAVEAKVIKLSVEDKAVETDLPYQAEKDSPTPLPSTDFIKRGVTASKRRFNGPYLGSFNKYVPDMYRRDIHYAVPSATRSEQPTPTSWSSSSYCSLPSQHGIPNFPTSAESAKCDICIAETEKNSVKNTLSQELHQSPVSSSTKNSDKSTLKRAQLTEYVQQIAKKYLGPKPNLSGKSKDDTKELQSDVNVPDHPKTEVMSSAFEKKIIPDFKIDYVEQQKNDRQHTVPIQTKKTESVLQIKDKLSEPDLHIPNRKEREVHDIYDKIKSVDSPKSPKELSEYDIEAKRIQLIQQVLGRQIPQPTFDSSPKAVSVNNLAQMPEDESQINGTSVPGQIRLNAKPHVYHELSTILEMDSALTTDSYQASRSKMFETSNVKEKSNMVLEEALDENLELSGEGLKMVSLLDPPDTSVAELAKSIRFISKVQEGNIQPSVAPPASSADFVSSKSSSLVPSSFISSSDSNSHTSDSSSGKVFSSTLTGNVKPPYVKDTKFLTPYFSNVSDISQKSSISEKYRLSPLLPSSEFFSSLNTPSSIPSNFESRSKVKKNSEQCLILESNDSPVFSSNHSNLYKSGSQLERQKNTLFSSGSINSPIFSIHSTPSTNNSKLTEEGTNVPSLISGYISNVRSDSGSFHPMTPYSDVSSPTVRRDESVNYKKELVQGKQILFGQNATSSFSSDTSGSFKPMTPHSYVSSPRARANSVPGYQAYSNSAESFKALTPVSNLSPSLPSSAVEFKYEKGSSEFYPMKVKLDISTDSVSSRNKRNHLDPKEKPLSLNYHLTLKTPVPENINFLKPLEEKAEEKIKTVTSKNTNNERKISPASEFIHNLPLREKKLLESKATINAKVCSSDYFTPQFCAGDISNAEEKKTYLEKAVLHNKYNEDCSKSKQITGGSPINMKRLSNAKQMAVESVSSYDEIIIKNFVENDMEVKSKESNVKKNLQDFEMARDFFKQFSNLPVISSTSSSTENLSEISGSKVLYQSTPIKCIEELVQEPGILQEPDLTLVTNDYSCKSDLNQNECVTPPNQSIRLLGSVDTPSMISFLQHETSCMKDATNFSKHMLVESPTLTPDTVEKQTSVKENLKTEKTKYKHRTQRLWNNLEEVKKRNLEKERKKIVAANRLKAKEFAKKLTPKRK